MNNNTKLRGLQVKVKAKLGWNREDLAEFCETTVQHLGRMLSGRAGVKGYLLIALEFKLMEGNV